MSEIFSNFTLENRAEELAHTSEKVLFELSSFSKFSQNSLTDSKISPGNACIGSIYLPQWGIYIASRCGFAVYPLSKAMREAY